ncbi:hypothetical protein HMJ29_10860 [Hymenobacter taeanensis]|uniref:Outer membrane beta-barrel protein n=1 Tax=Hymenobacter taeanensis TaxID=2735321 RepID=A0A6M6BH80_9BACT|nr:MULTISPECIES: hypothetical protein [Hymenobacter]QJX47409.1 hypothetical protein HMJ29_10860 [Hymenobacter taeanensis]UOQ79251.1 hypothetical protein MUN83_10255 [Hymenobacter sp. 5414T-23]
MKRLVLISLFLGLLGCVEGAYAQSKKKSSGGGAGYTTGIGLRGGGWSSGLSVKHFLSGKNNVAFEGLLTREYAARGGRLTLMLEKHLPVYDFKGLQFYYGAGAHVGSYRGRYYFTDERFRRGKKYDYYYIYRNDDTNYLVGGADLILGLEYKMEDLPFVIGVDYKPFFEVFDGYTGFYNDAAVNLRFVF